MSRKDYSLDPNVIASLRGVAQKGIWLHRWKEEDKKDSDPTTCQRQVSTLIPYRKFHLVVSSCTVSFHCSCISNTTHSHAHARPHAFT